MGMCIYKTVAFSGSVKYKLFSFPPSPTWVFKDVQSRELSIALNDNIQSLDGFKTIRLKGKCYIPYCKLQIPSNPSQHKMLVQKKL